MENSLKGVVITLTILGLFVTAILNFIVLFPQEQGVSYSGLEDANAYLTINNNKNLNISTNLNELDNSTTSAFDQWDITQGFMGSNALKQGQDKDINSYNTNIFSTLILIAKILFKENSPILYVLGIIFILSSTIITYYVIKWIRQGQ